MLDLLAKQGAVCSFTERLSKVKAYGYRTTCQDASNSRELLAQATDAAHLLRMLASCSAGALFVTVLHLLLSLEQGEMASCELRLVLHLARAPYVETWFVMEQRFGCHIVFLPTL